VSHDANSGECGRSWIILSFNEMIIINNNIMYSCTLFIEKTDNEDNHDDKEKAIVPYLHFLIILIISVVTSLQCFSTLRKAGRQAFHMS
jgi:hypothetical protein